MSPFGPLKSSGSEDRSRKRISSPDKSSFYLVIFRSKYLLDSETHNAGSKSVLILERVKSIIDICSPKVLMTTGFPSRMNVRDADSFRLKRIFPLFRMYDKSKIKKLHKKHDTRRTRTLYAVTN